MSVASLRLDLSERALLHPGEDGRDERRDPYDHLGVLRVAVEQEHVTEVREVLATSEVREETLLRLVAADLSQDVEQDCSEPRVAAKHRAARGESSAVAPVGLLAQPAQRWLHCGWAESDQRVAGLLDAQLAFGLHACEAPQQFLRIGRCDVPRAAFELRAELGDFARELLDALGLGGAGSVRLC